MGSQARKKKQKQKTNMFAFISQITIYAGTNEHSEEISVCVRAFRDRKNYPTKKTKTDGMRADCSSGTPWCGEFHVVWVIFCERTVSDRFHGLKGIFCHLFIIPVFGSCVKWSVREHCVNKWVAPAVLIYFWWPAVVNMEVECYGLCAHSLRPNPE